MILAYKQALENTLRSMPKDGSMQTVTVWNNLPIDGQLFYVSEYASLVNLGFIPTGYAAEYDLAEGDYLLFKSRYTGSLIGISEISDTTSSVFFGFNTLVEPNAIGLPPTPNQQVVIPQSTPRVLVGAGVLENNNRVVREQYWMRMPDSFSILPGESQEVSSTSTSAIQQTTSEMDTVTKSVGASVSGGWGPVSASVTASLGTNSTTMQELSVSTEHTSFISDKITGGKASAEFFVKWQLMDVVNILRVTDGKILSSIVTGQAPVLFNGPFVLSELPPVPDIPRELGKVSFPRNRLQPRGIRSQSAQKRDNLHLNQ